MFQDLITPISKLHARIQTQQEVDLNSYRKLEESQKALAQHVKLGTSAKEVIRTVSREYLDQDKGEVEKLLTDGICRIFGEHYDIKISVSDSAKRADIEIYKDGSTQPISVKEGTGAGVLEFASFLLRLYFISKFKLLPFVLMDEKLAFIAQKYVPQVSEFINQLCSEYGLDVLLVTHNSLYADHSSRTYEVFRDDTNTHTQVRKIK